MIKSAFKEIAIILLLILAILILLTILFYDYMPSSKTVPAKVEPYALAEDVKQELEKELNSTKSEEIIKTYQIDTVELENYEKTKKYNKGKVNPFAESSTGTANNNSNTSTGNGQTNNSTNTTGSQGSNNSSGTFLNTVGK